MDMDTFDILAVEVAAQLGTLVYDKASPPLLLRKMGERRAVQARTDDQVVVDHGVVDYFFKESSKCSREDAFEKLFSEFQTIIDLVHKEVVEADQRK